MEGRDASGKFLPGYTANPSGRPKKEHALTDLILATLDESIDIYYDMERQTKTRKQIMAKHICDMIVFGKIVLPSALPGGPGRVLTYNGDEYFKHIIKTLRYVEPPVEEINTTGDVDHIIIDIPQESKDEFRRMMKDRITDEGDEEDEFNAVKREREEDEDRQLGQ